MDPDVEAIESDPADFRCETRVWTDRVVVHVAGELDLASAPRLRSTVELVIIPNGLPVVIDLTEVRFIDSSGVHALIDADLTAQRLGVDLLVNAPGPTIKRVFELLGLAEQLNFVADHWANQRADDGKEPVTG